MKMRRFDLPFSVRTAKIAPLGNHNFDSVVFPLDNFEYPVFALCPLIVFNSEVLVGVFAIFIRLLETLMDLFLCSEALDGVFAISVWLLESDLALVDALLSELVCLEIISEVFLDFSLETPEMEFLKLVLLPLKIKKCV